MHRNAGYFAQLSGIRLFESVALLGREYWYLRRDAFVITPTVDTLIDCWCAHNLDKENFVKTRKTYFDRIERYGPLSDVVFRVLFSLIFIIGGLGHFGQHQDMLLRIHESPWFNVVRWIGDPSVLLWLSGAVFVVAGFSFAMGFMTRLTAAALFVTLVPVTLAIHIAPGHVGALLKNVAILGGLLHFFVRGPGAYALDGRLKNSVDR
jgi:putative oxidoreductase